MRQCVHHLRSLSKMSCSIRTRRQSFMCERFRLANRDRLTYLLLTFLLVEVVLLDAGYSTRQ